MKLSDVQSELKAMALYIGNIDERYGSRTDDAAEALLANQRVVGFEA